MSTHSGHRSPGGPDVLIEITMQSFNHFVRALAVTAELSDPALRQVLRLIASLFQLLMFLDCTRREKPIANRFISANTRWTELLRYYHQAGRE